VSLDTTLPNRLIGNALKQGAMSEFAAWQLDRHEVRIGKSRFDFLLRAPASRKLVLEVKSVTLVENRVGLFPDAVTVRGARHVRELASVARRRNWRAAVLFVAQRSDASRIHAARGIDPDFADALEEAKAAGVRVLGRRCRVKTDRVTLGSAVPVD
jgi:sugar fermentation stimulation protein A